MKKILFIVFLICSMVSCESDLIENPNGMSENKIILTTDELTSIAYDNCRTLSENEVLDIVNDFSKSLASDTRSISVPVASIEELYYIGGNYNLNTRSSNTGEIPIYRVNLKTEGTEGYAIVSADSRSASVLAYISNGIFENNSYTGADLMVKLAEITTIYEINRIEELKASLRDKTLSKISSLLGTEHVTYEDVKDIIKVNDNPYLESTSRSPAYDNPLTTVISKVGPITKTKWSQDVPYNIYLPRCYNPEWRFPTHYPAGCGIIAGAQALAAVANNISINGVLIDWEYLTANPTVNYDEGIGGDDKAMNMVCTLVKNMYEETGTTPNIVADFQYNWYEDKDLPAVESSSTSTLKLMDYLKKYVHCGTYYSKYAPDPLLSTLNTNASTPCVAVMGGTHTATETAKKGSHAWVIDGYAICQKKTREILKNYDLYFHANMGWAGSDNGWYKVNADNSTAFETELGNYNVNFWEITDIRKK